jgi:cell division protein FtsL
VNVRLRRSGQLQRALIATALGGMVGASALVWTRTDVLSTRYRMGELMKRRAELVVRVEKLEVEVAALSSPDRVERRALELGLRYPEPGQVVRATPRQELLESSDLIASADGVRP